jgi:hypothetical protein
LVQKLLGLVTTMDRASDVPAVVNLAIDWIVLAEPKMERRQEGTENVPMRLAQTIHSIAQ